MATSGETETDSSFRNRMTSVVSSGHILAGLSLGVKLGLFKAMIELDRPVTSHQLADHTDCKERYVREWLHHMVVSDVIDVDVTGKLFTLPRHRRQALVADDEIVTGLSSMFSHFLTAHKEVLACFANDGPNGLPFESVVAGLKEWTGSPKRDEMCIEQILEAYTSQKLEAGATFLDIGCGTGTFITMMAERFPNSTFVGIDPSPDMMNEATKDHKAANITNTEFLLKDAIDLPAEWNDRFDYAFILNTLHDMPYPVKALDNVFRCLKPDGKLSVIEFRSSSNIHETLHNPAEKAGGVIGYMGSIYHCLVSSMYYPDSAALGTLPGIDVLTNIVTSAKFRVHMEPKRCGDSYVHLTFTKSVISVDEA